MTTRGAAFDSVPISSRPLPSASRRSTITTSAWLLRICVHASVFRFADDGDTADRADEQRDPLPDGDGVIDEKHPERGG